jgi:predicted acetyltransferase
VHRFSLLPGAKKAKKKKVMPEVWLTLKSDNRASGLVVRPQLGSLDSAAEASKREKEVRQHYFKETLLCKQIQIS